MRLVKLSNHSGPSQRARDKRCVTAKLRVAKETNNPVNQAKLKVNTCSWHKARENVCE